MHNFQKNLNKYAVEVRKNYVLILTPLFAMFFSHTEKYCEET